MDNQHRLIKGYKELDSATIAKMNTVKALGNELQTVVLELRGDAEVDQRWVSLGQTHLQMGLMFLTRAIAKPDFF